MQLLIKPLNSNNLLAYLWTSSLNTRVDIVLYADVEAECYEALSGDIQRELDRIMRFANRFDSKSELSNINSHGYGRATKISSELYSIIEDCIGHTRRTMGCFDITVNSLSAINDGSSYIKLLDNSMIELTHPDLRLDLNGYIKGYALERVIDIIKGAGFRDALINIGNSSVAALGNHPVGSGWRVSPSQGQHPEVTLTDSCLSVSGNIDMDSPHIKDPYSGKVVDKSATVMISTTSPIDAEVLSTTIFSQIGRVEEYSKEVVKNYPIDTKVYL